MEELLAYYNSLPLRSEAQDSDGFIPDMPLNTEAEQYMRRVEQ